MHPGSLPEARELTRLLHGMRGGQSGANAGLARP
jgi:hypothetical protein